LDLICQYVQHVLGLATDNKWLIGHSAGSSGYHAMLKTVHARGWKYIACPNLPVGNGSTKRKNAMMSTSDDVLKDVFRIFMGTGAFGQYVFISDDGDFIPDMEACLAHGHDVTLFVSGKSTSASFQERIHRLKQQGVHVVSIRDLLPSSAAEKQTEGETESAGQSELATLPQEKVAGPAPTVVPDCRKESTPTKPSERKLPTTPVRDKVQTAETVLVPVPAPSWAKSAPPESPLARFNRRYGAKHA
jgi:hypothetical protein